MTDKIMTQKFNLEKELLDITKDKERTSRLIKTIVPQRGVYAETCQRLIADETRETKSNAYQVVIPTDISALGGLTSCFEKVEDVISFANMIANFRFSLDNSYCADIGNGLYTMITTQRDRLYSCRPVYIGEGSNKIMIGMVVVISTNTLWKVALGPLVDDNGRAISGAGEIVRHAKEKILEIIKQGQLPHSFASVVVHDKKKGTSSKFVIRGKPIDIVMTRQKDGGAPDALVVLLSSSFYPFKDENAPHAKDLFIHQVAGLTSFIQYGAWLYKQGNRKGGIDTITARRLILAIQAAYELSYYISGIRKQAASGRINLELRIPACRDLYPSAFDSTGWIRYKEFSNAVACAGQYYLEAAKATGILNELRSDKKIIFPAIEKGAEFDKSRNIVRIKADPVLRVIDVHD